MNIKKNLVSILKYEQFYVMLSFFLPLIFYVSIFFGKSFGFDCAPAVMGNYPPFGQTLTTPNMFCTSILDPGAYTWQFPPMWASVARQFLQGHFAIWSQNIGIGIPLAANFQSNAFNIVLLPFILLFKISNFNLLFLDLFFVFRYMIMSLGMYLFLRSFKLDRIICLIGSLALFSSGYYIYVPTIAHHNVDLWLPLIAWSINNFYFKKDIRWMATSALLLGLSMLGGMPESSVFILFLVALYSSFLSIFYLKTEKIKYFILGNLIWVFGLLISAIQYVPGVEYILNSYNNHSGGGAQKFMDFKNIFLFILPKLFAGTSFFWSGHADKLDFSPQNWNYIGSIISFLFVMGLINIKKIFKGIKTNKENVIYFFYLTLTTILVLQLYGIVHIFVFELFPGFKETQFNKYSSTLINFSLITTMALSLPYLIKYKNKLQLLIYCLSVSFLVYLNFHYQEMIKANYFIVKRFGFASNIFYALIFITIITFVIYKIKNSKIILLTILILLLGEYYIYFPRLGDKNRRDSFRTPPAINFLKKLPYKDSRIFAVDNILFPNLATIYDLNDIRMLDALWSDRYFLYMKNFFAEPDAFRITGIKENIATQSANIIDNPYFDMLSVKHILSFNKIETVAIENSSIDSILKQNSKAVLISKTIFDINKDQKQVLFEHAPNDITAMINKPTGAMYLTLYPALSPNLFRKKEGDGVRFIAKVSVDNMQVDSQEVFIDASNKKSDEKWFALKLGPFPNSTESYDFNLQLVTDQRDNNAFDWAGWGGFEWDTNVNKTISKYKLVYDKEMKIYENKDYIPRLRFINETLCLKPNLDKEKNYDNVINLMKINKDKIRNLAVLESNNCKGEKYNPSAIRVIEQKFSDQEISFIYSSKEDQYGVLSDLYYPGWEIYINDKKGKIEPINLALRGFKLPRGNNKKVIIKYKPVSFRISAVISITSILLLFVIINRYETKERQSKKKK